MKTKDYINLLQAVKAIPLPGEKSGDVVDEIIERLRVLDDLLSLLENLEGNLKDIVKYLDDLRI